MASITQLEVDERGQWLAIQIGAVVALEYFNNLFRQAPGRVVRGDDEVG